MSNINKKLSGSANRKRAQEIEEKNKMFLSKVPKIQTFFVNKESSDHSILQPVDMESNLLIEEGYDTPQPLGVDNNLAIENEDNSNNQSEEEDSIVGSSISEKLFPDQSTNKTFGTGSDFSFNSDPYAWEINETLINYIAKYGFQQNMDKDFANSKRNYPDFSRYLTKSFFEQNLSNGSKKIRNWLTYSPSYGRLYCGVCLALNTGTQLGSKEGFNDWKNPQRLKQHENSDLHRNSILSLKARSNQLGLIETQLFVGLENEKKYWQDVLRRVVSVVKQLASRGLPFRGSSEVFGSLNNGNYMMSLELLAEYDPFLAAHIAKLGNPGSGKTSYLSSTICDEIIKLMSKKVLEKIFDEIRIAKYFSVIIDSTPDLSHVDQLTVVIRYVTPDGYPIERFIMFLPNVGHTGTQMADALLNVLEKANINIKNCRGQSYDNATNMSGKYNGVQSHIRQSAEYAEFVPCSGHSLNLVGSCSASSCMESCQFFNNLQGLFNFFSASTTRWSTLQEEIDLYLKEYKNKFPNDDKRKNRLRESLKNLSTTRWHARHDATDSLIDLWAPVHRALIKIEEDLTEKPGTRCQAHGLRSQLERLETAFMLHFWGFLLFRINKVSKSLQKQELDIITVQKLFDSLIELIKEMRQDEEFDRYEKLALDSSVIKEYEIKRVRENNFEEARDNFRVNVFYIILDNLLNELKKRKEQYHNFAEKFSFILKLKDLSSKEIHDKAKALILSYPDDLDDYFINECVHFKAHCKVLDADTLKSTITLLHYLRENDLCSIYPGIDIALHICVSTALSNCTGERSFSALKRVENYLRTTSSQGRINDLALLSIESQVMLSLEFEDIIEQFAASKCRKKILR